MGTPLIEVDEREIVGAAVDVARATGGAFRYEDLRGMAVRLYDELVAEVRKKDAKSAG